MLIPQTKNQQVTKKCIDTGKKKLGRWVWWWFFDYWFFLLSHLSYIFGFKLSSFECYLYWLKDSIFYLLSKFMAFFPFLTFHVFKTVNIEYNMFVYSWKSVLELLEYIRRWQVCYYINFRNESVANIHTYPFHFTPLMLILCNRRRMENKRNLRKKITIETYS